MPVPAEQLGQHCSGSMGPIQAGQLILSHITDPLRHWHLSHGLPVIEGIEAPEIMTLEKQKGL
ncbi:hypothetical protein DPMN_001948 [Dreissena polymorpha]|uniref:Uncharacterized protein n=1 Tax=Dreissena polymorpha TaxID=45954 RepID=A0A9D4MMP1_DREPO|nr:hypothetical protein DPMN_001948 [Dreissena polymorpha]